MSKKAAAAAKRKPTKKAKTAARKPKKLVSMSQNPQNDWTMKDVETVCRALKMECQAPTGGGSHHKVYSQDLRGPLTIPAKKPIKAFYIKKFVTKCETQWKLLNEKEATDE
ncbi:MAG: hypothetical protein ABJG15_00445 [Hyphomonadaceae bacterium]